MKAGRMKKGRGVLVSVLFLAAGILLMDSCSKNTGILYKIFNVSYKTFDPLDNKPEKLFRPLLGEYILANERALIISAKDSATYTIKFLPQWITEEPKILSGYITTLNSRKYLNLFTDDDSYLVVRIDTLQDSVAMKLVTHHINAYMKGLSLKEYLKKDGNIPDTSSAFFVIPSCKMLKGEGEKWSSGRLKNQIKDLETYHRYLKLFPADSVLAELRKSAIDMTLNKTNSVNTIHSIIQKYPEATEAGKARALRVCNTTKNCLDFISYFPVEAMRDSVPDKAFFYAKSVDDLRTVIAKFPDHRMVPAAITRLFYEEKAKCKTEAELDGLRNKYASNAGFLRAEKVIRAFEKLPFDSIQFNTSSYVLTKNAKPVIERLMMYISEANRERHVIHDVYVVVNCNIVPADADNAAKINFKQSCNRIVSLKKCLSVNPPKNVRFHYIPAGSSYKPDSLSDGRVRFLLNEKEADDYKSIFMKLSVAWRKDFIIPNADREFISEVYLRELELEEYVGNYMAERLLVDKKAQFKIIPVNFWKEECGKELPEFNEVRYYLLQMLNQKKLKRRKPGDYVYDLR